MLSLHHSDYRKGIIAYLDLLAHRLAGIVKKLKGRIISQHRHIALRTAVRIAYAAAIGYVIAHDIDIILTVASYGGIAHGLIAVL